MKKTNVLFASSLLLLSLTACENHEVLKTKATTVKNAQNQSVSQNVEENNYLQLETKDLEKKNSSTFIESSSNYIIEAITYQSIQNKIEIDINLTEPKSFMKNIIISGILMQNAYQYLHTSDLLVSNVLIKDSFSDKETTKQYTISPKIESPAGISTGRSFNLLPDIKFEEAAANIKEVYLKISWVDKDNKNHTEYIKTNIINKRPE
ncbi:hypothetical protein [Bacillus sp. AFS053548]|uniref:hypothetical protein n=1 Tax=Bacillus sp. AFS053548 TaxID=2033505 RepID=UPI000BFB3284|nr:hypothetical protein [Bacillus sp. AFS053548]PGM59567.1 hypothetical protein CN946_01090 [Bacillus sp. AFS053548]